MSILSAIGNTPIIELNNLCENNDVKIFGKLEGCNPSGSVKDRPAYHMIKKAEESGDLKKNKIILGYRIFIRSVEEKPLVILLSFKNYSLGQEKQLINYLRTKKEITQSLRLFGIWNMFIHVREKDIENVQRLLIELRDKFDIIDDYEIIPVFELM